MELSAELLSQFTKVTNDTTKNTKKESFVYGTTVKHNGRTYVQLDGSELLTPVSTTTNTQAGERVTVMIKNHTATVTGNISSPSARLVDVDDNVDTITQLEILIAGKVDTDVFTAATGRIDDLVADNISVKQQISANNAVVGQIKAENVEIESKLRANSATIDELITTKIDAVVADAKYATIDDLEATNADIYNLEATYATFAVLTTNDLRAIHATIDDLDATYATIDDLDVERGRINILEANAGEIQSLIFGSATGNVIHTSFANAVIAQLGNAQIKSAMIENLTADKIRSGSLVTNNVNVQSDSGNLLIANETIRISDGRRVRVQIGKDGTGDYSINVWDSAGNLMFSEGGITDSAIKEAIIRNDMVSDTANIAAHKLDIDSLFEEINDGTHTIKSSKILFDDEGQTLDVIFTEMSSQLDEIQNGVMTQGTQLSVIQGQIESKIWLQDISGNDSDLSETMYSVLRQDLDSVSITVANNTSTLETMNTDIASLVLNVDGLTSRISSTEYDAEGTLSRVSEAETLIQQLTESVSMMVTDGNGQSLMTQTETGWTFSTSELQSVVNATSEGLDALVNEMNDVNSTVDILQQAVTDIGVIGEYVKIGVYEEEPCIELGESDSDFKLLITNTRIMFMEGTGVPAYINNQTLHIKKAVIEEELQQGNFVWKARSNGNMGLVWKGAIN